jgi:hypothetical protein
VHAGNEAPSCNWPGARDASDFTVPRGHPSAALISASERSSKYRKTMTALCLGGSRPTTSNSSLVASPRAWRQDAVLRSVAGRGVFGDLRDEPA